MKSPPCRRRCRKKSCAWSNTARWSAWAVPKRCAWTCGWSRRPTSICARWPATGVSARICSTGFRSRSSRCAAAPPPGGYSPLGQSFRAPDGPRTGPRAAAALFQGRRARAPRIPLAGQRARAQERGRADGLSLRETGDRGHRFRSVRGRRSDASHHLVHSVHPIHSVHLVRSVHLVNFTDLSALPLPEAVRALELRRLRQALEESRYNQRKAAERLGLSYHQFSGLFQEIPQRA